MKNHTLTFTFLLLAIVLYVAGMAIPATVFLVLGALAEGVFWVRLLNSSGRKSAK